jgi:hypothetical protein
MAQTLDDIFSPHQHNMSQKNKDTVTWSPKIGIIKSEETYIARQLLGKHIKRQHIPNPQSNNFRFYASGLLTHFATIEEAVFSVGPPWGYITRIYAARIRIGSSSGVGSRSRELRESAVEDDWEGMASKELDCAKKSSCVIQIIPRFLQIRCQDTTSEEWEP